MGKSESFTFPVYSFRQLETPQKKRGNKDYYAVVKLADLPDFSRWRKINVRDPKLTGTVPRKIRESVVENPELFVFLNRGLVVSVASISFNNNDNTVTITLEDPDDHGLLDGGHTYNILLEEREELEFDQFVKIEFLEGFDVGDIPRIVDARNSSNQVKSESLLNLEHAFEGIQKALKGRPYADQIAYKEFQIDPKTGEPKPIDIREVVGILTAFDKEHYDDRKHPIIAYSSKEACLKHFRVNMESYEKIYPIAASILELYDEIEYQLPELYNRARPRFGDGMGGKFGKLTGVRTYKAGRNGQTLILERETSYSVPTGFIYPILGAFRALVEEKDGEYQWARGVNPTKLLLGDLGERLAETIGKFARDERNPSKTGKSAIVWDSCYQAGENTFLRLKK